MTATQTKTAQVRRRSELMAELFLQELEPEFVAQPAADDFAFDFLIGFLNQGGGTNIYAVEVRATENPLRGTYRLPRSDYDRFVNSNMPLLLLVVDVKQNTIYFAWPAKLGEVKSTGPSVELTVTRIDDASRKSLRQQMTCEVGGS